MASRLDSVVVLQGPFSFSQSLLAASWRDAVCVQAPSWTPPSASGWRSSTAARFWKEIPQNSAICLSDSPPARKAQLIFVNVCCCFPTHLWGGDVQQELSCLCRHRIYILNTAVLWYHLLTCVHFTAALSVQTHDVHIYLMHSPNGFS